MSYVEEGAGSHRQFLEALSDMDGVLWEMDARTWRFTFVSERAERLFGYPVTDWYEQPTFWQDRLIHPEDRDWCVNFCTVASGQCRDHAFLYRALRADGRVVWIKDVVRVFSDPSGVPTRMRGVMVEADEEIVNAPRAHGGELDFHAPDLAELRSILAA